jgi:integrase
LDKGIILHYPRPKTGIDRDSPLTQETVASIKECLNNRRDDPLVFRSKVGKSWHPTSIAHALAKLVRSIPGIGKTRITLGDLRHTFSTYALETLDTDAWKRLMGHKLPGLKSVYVTLLIPRLRAVVEYVGARLTGRQSHPALVPTFAVSVPSPPLETL